MTYETERSVALAAVRDAARVCSRVFARGGSDAIRKGDASPVTVADFASQAIVCRGLSNAFPDDPIIAEESSVTLEGDGYAALRRQIVADVGHVIPEAAEMDVLSWIDQGAHDSRSERYWTVDPVDGTKGFLRGDQFAVALALIEDGRPVVACLACPNLDPRAGPGRGSGVILVAVRGQGTTMEACDGQVGSWPAKVSSAKQGAAVRWCESVEPGHSRHADAARVASFLRIQTPPIRMDSQTKYALVARGDAAYYLRLPAGSRYRENIWDHAAGALVVEEAGGRVSDLRGRRLDFGHGRYLQANAGVVASNGAIHEAVLEALGKADLVPD